MIFRNFVDQDWVGFNFFRSRSEMDKKWSCFLWRQSPRTLFVGGTEEKISFFPNFLCKGGYRFFPNFFSTKKISFFPNFLFKLMIVFNFSWKVLCSYFEYALY